MPLLNVRLDAEDARRAKALRGDGVEISGVVRDAIRAEYDRHFARRRGGRRASEIVAQILASLPDPQGTSPRSFALDDRRAVRRHIAAKLRRDRA